MMDLCGSGRKEGDIDGDNGRVNPLARKERERLRDEARPGTGALGYGLGARRLAVGALVLSAVEILLGVFIA